MRVFLNLDDVKVEIPNFDIHNVELPRVGDYWESPSQEDIKYRLERGYMRVVNVRKMGNDGKLREVGIPPNTKFKVTKRLFKMMDCREVVLTMEKA